MRQPFLILRIGLSLTFLVAAACTRAAPAACSGDEESLFSCATGRKQIAVCASHGWSANSGYLQYRFGSEKAAELTLPVKPDSPPSGSASSGMLSLTGGGGAYLRFSQGDTDYVVFSAVSANWGEKSGVSVLKAGKPVATVRCRGEARSELGPDLFQRGGFAPDTRGFMLPD